MENNDTPSIPDGYEDISISIMDILQGAQRLALILFTVPILMHIIVYGLSDFWGDVFNLKTLLLAVPTIMLFIVAHELIHALGWVIFGRFSPKHIKFGIDRATFSPYAHATIPMNATAYRIGAALPGIITGLFPTIYGLVYGDGAITLLGAFMTSAAVGDIYVLWVIRTVSSNATVIDHPSKAGCFVKIED